MITDKNLKETLQGIPYQMATALAKVVTAANEAAVADWELKVLKAQISIDIRQNPINYGFPKTTETLVDDLVLIQAAVVKAKQKSIAADLAYSSVKAELETLASLQTVCNRLTDLIVCKFTSS